MSENDDVLIVTSKVKPILKNGAGVTTVSGEALAWVNKRTREFAELCASTGTKTPSGKLMPPPALSGAIGPATYRDPLSAKAPERMCARGKEALDEPGAKSGMTYALVEVRGGQADVVCRAGPVEVIILDRAWLDKSLGIPECSTEINVLCHDLRVFAKESKRGEYEELAGELEHKHAKLLKELNHTPPGKEKKK